MYSVIEYITDNVPYAKKVYKAFLPMNVFVDTTDTVLKSNLQMAHKMKDKTRAQRLKSLVDREVSIGSYLYSGDIDYGLGRVVSFFKDETMMLVMFNERELPTMCSRNNLTTIHDDDNRKLKVIW